MFAIIGLGNPGQKYQHTRHNVGFCVVDVIHGEFAASSQFQEKFGCLYLKENICKESIRNQPTLLIKPQKYMNLSGQTVLPLLNFFKIEPENLIVVHDDVDLSLGRIRIRQNGSSGGHNGVQDLINVLGTDEFYRIKVGIGRPPRATDRGVVDWVLTEFKGEEMAVIGETVKKASNVAVVLMSEGLEKARRLL